MEEKYGKLCFTSCKNIHFTVKAKIGSILKLMPPSKLDSFGAFSHFPVGNFNIATPSPPARSSHKT